MYFMGLAKLTTMFLLANLTFSPLCIRTGRSIRIDRKKRRLDSALGPSVQHTAD